MKAVEAGTLEVCELFRSIAGETTRAGLPAVFVRLSGCNLRCHWCDTMKSWEPGRNIPVGALIGALRKLPERLVVVTGGEPLLQAGTLTLCRGLLGAGCEVLLETNGSLDISPVPEGVHTILDVKCPGSAESHHHLPSNLERLRPGDELKFVLADRTDFDFALAFLFSRPMPPGVNVLLSPAFQLLDPASLASWMLESGCQARLQLQLQHVLWPKGGEGRALDLEQILDEPRDSK